MEHFKNPQLYSLIFLLSTFIVQLSHSATVKEVFSPDSLLTRLPRDSNYQDRYSAASSDTSNKNLKPEESPEATRDGSPLSLGKRCVRCDTGYLDRYPSDRTRYNDDRYREYDRYDDRYADRDRYSGRDRYADKDRYSDDRYYERYDRYTDTDRYPYQSRYQNRYDRYSTDRYSDRYPEYERNDRYDPYERTDPYDRYADRGTDRGTDRGIGYDNRGYDYRGSERDAYRPIDDAYRGSSEYDGARRGYYSGSGRPDYYGSNRYGGSGSGGGYASGYDYNGSSTGRDDYYNRDRYAGSGGSRYRDPYDSYRTTSYLYGRPSSTTDKPSNSDDRGNTPSPQENSG